MRRGGFKGENALQYVQPALPKGRPSNNNPGMNKVGSPPLANAKCRIPRGGWCALVLASLALMTHPRRAEASWAVSDAFTNLTFTEPCGFTAEPRANRLYVSERLGKIYFFTNSPAVSAAALFLDLSAVTQGNNDCGLVGFALHPEYGMAGSTNRGYVYVDYCYSPSPNPNPTSDTRMYNRVSRFTVPDGSLVADPASELVLINQFDRNYWHNGGGMFFGADGYLYVANGDEGDANDSFNNSQIITNGFFCGVFRIDVDMNLTRSHAIRRRIQDRGGIPAGWPPTTNGNYTVPNDNPWLDPSGSVLEEFYAIGLRNAFRMTFDPPTGNIWVGDVGQDKEEEVDLLQKGGNYQWAYAEGPIAGPKPKPSPLVGTETPPIWSYPHSVSRCIIGGCVYRGTQFAPALTGLYFFGDYVSGRIWTLEYNGNSNVVVRDLCTMPQQLCLTSFGTDQSGEMYFCSFVDGRIMKLNQRPDPAPFVAMPTLISGSQAALNFTNYPGLSFSVIGANDPTLPLTNWTWLGQVSETSPGVYSFTNTVISGTPAYYRVRQP
jgi:glucose/arabinose dehydrogenase